MVCEFVISFVFSNNYVEPSFDHLHADDQEKWKETMESAYWDDILESVKQDEPNYSHVWKLMTEIHDEIYVMAPRSWKQEVFEEIDLENLTQVSIIIVLLYLVPASLISFQFIFVL